MHFHRTFGVAAVAVWSCVAFAQQPAPATPHQIMASRDGQWLPVEAVSWTNPQVKTGDVLVNVPVTGPFTVENAKEFAPGFVQVEGPSQVNEQAADERGEVMIHATIMASDTLEDCWVALVACSRSAPDGIARVVFQSIGTLRKERPEDVVVSYDNRTPPTYRSDSVAFLVFSKGVEVQTSQSEASDALIRSVRGRIAFLRDYVKKFEGADHSVEVIRRVAPDLPPDVNISSLPKSVDVTLHVSAEGAVDRVEVKQQVPMGVYSAVVLALSQWEFLPRVKQGVAVATKVQVPIVLRKPAPNLSFPTSSSGNASGQK